MDRTLGPVVSDGVWRDLVNEYGTPLVIVDATVIRERCRVLKTNLPNAIFYYALKANYNPFIVELILNQGFGFDAVSPNELALALAVGARPEQIVYVENNASPDDIRTAVDAGVRVVAGSLTSLARICHRWPGARVGVRINGDIGASAHRHTFTAGPKSKFGIHHTQIDQVLEIARSGRTRIDYLHQHIGSSWLGVDPFIKSVGFLLETVERFDDVGCVDFGGGFGVPYHPDDRHIDFAGLGRRLGERLGDFARRTGRRLDIAFEPGRFVVAESAVLLTTVTDRKAGVDGRVFVGTDTGFNHLVRPVLYNGYHDIRNLTGGDRPTDVVDVCGNLCEDTDFLARERPIPSPREGDVLAIMDVGAYGLCQASEYNLRTLPAEVMIDGGTVTLIRPRRRFADILDGFGYRPPAARPAAGAKIAV